MGVSETNNDGKSLLSLSIAAASANPVLTGASPEPEQECEPESDVQQDSGISLWSPSPPVAGTSGSLPSAKSSYQIHKYRRMSSLGQSRRRTSDAREAITRPSAAAFHTGASTLASLATLSLSPSKPENIPRKEGQSDIANQEADARLEGLGVSVSLPKEGKKGAIFKCETCSKVYRHPSCLVKHRWEHSPHWRETSKFLLSKHQQVQLLEAAAILSHLAPSARGGASLPEDRGLWPAYLSGGKLYPTTSITTTPTNATPVAEKPFLSMSSSLPNSSQLSRSSHPTLRVHEYAVTSAKDVKHVRPGVFSIGRNDLCSSINRAASSPVGLHSATDTSGISSRSMSDGAWNPYSPSVASRSPYSPPTEDDSDFEMDEQSALSHVDHSRRKREEIGGKTSEWDGLEMEMEM